MRISCDQLPTKEAVIQMNQPLSGDGYGSFGGFAVLANEGDKGLCGPREAAVAAVDEAKLTPEIDAFDVQKLYLASFHLVARETFADERNAGISADKSLDHTDAGKLHRDANARAIGAKQLVQNLARVASAGKNE